MYNGKKVTAIITAGGRGTRMGTEIPKQFLPLGGRTILEKAIEPFERADFVDDILVVVGQDFVTLCCELVAGFGKVRQVVAGGKERQDSVRNALDALKALDAPDTPDTPDTQSTSGNQDSYVLIHDGARPYVRPETIADVMAKAAQTGASVAAVPAKDTIRQVATAGDLDTSQTLDRSTIYQVQTPQGFDRALLAKAFDKAYRDGFYGTDDAVLVERLGVTVAIAQGSYDNIKITTPEDLPVETKLETKQEIEIETKKEAEMKTETKTEATMKMRIGTGYDVHRLTEGRDLVLCGVTIPWDKGLLGHSDADVALHALMDALLGACALGDIGKHFPDTDPQYKGISSLVLLAKVRDLVDEAGYRPGNVDLTIMAQRPKLLPYIPDMRARLAEALGLDLGAINVKATTTEGLGFVGREEGISAEAVCTIYKKS